MFGDRDWNGNGIRDVFDVLTDLEIMGVDTHLSDHRDPWDDEDDYDDEDDDWDDDDDYDEDEDLDDDDDDELY